MKKLLLLFLAMAVTLPVQPAKLYSNSETKPKIDVKWNLSHAIEKNVDSGHKETWTATLTNREKTNIDVRFDLDADVPSKITTKNPKLTLLPGKPISVKFEVQVFFKKAESTDCSQIGVDVMFNDYEVGRSIFVRFYPKIVWDACFAENGKKELTAYTDDIISKNVLLKVTNKGKLDKVLFVHKQYFRVPTNSSVTVNVRNIPLSPTIPYEIHIAEDYNMHVNLKLKVINNNLKKLPIKLKKTFEKIFAKYDHSKRSFFNYDNARFCCLTEHGYVLGYADTTKKTYSMKMVSLDGKTKWSYKTNYDCNYFIQHKNTLLLVDRANDGKTDTLDFVSLSSGKLTKQIRLPGFVGYWDIGNFTFERSGDMPYRINHPESDENRFIMFYFHKILGDEPFEKFLNLENLQFTDKQPVSTKQNIRYDLTTSKSKVKEIGELSIYVLKKYENNKLKWQVKIENQNEYVKPEKYHYYNVWFDIDPNSVFVCISNYQKSEGGGWVDEIIRIDPQSGKRTWQKRFQFSGNYTDNGKLYVLNKELGYFAIYDEFTGKLLGIDDSQSMDKSSDCYYCCSFEDFALTNGTLRCSVSKNRNSDTGDPPPQLKIMYFKVEFPKTTGF